MNIHTKKRWNELFSNWPTTAQYKAREEARAKRSAAAKKAAATRKAKASKK